MNSFFRLFLIFAAPATLLAGNGPGGVSTSLRLWLKPETIGKNAAGLSRWDDSSGTGLTLATPDAANTPAALTPDSGQRFNSRALTNPESYQNRPAPALYFKLNDPLGSPSAIDLFSPSRTGTPENGPLQQIKFFGSTGTDFDGVNDRILINGAPELQALRTNFRISVWIKPRTQTGFQRILSARSASGGWGFGRNGAGFLFTTYGIKDYQFNTVTVPPGVWSHLDLTVTGPNANATLRVNGGATFQVPANEQTVTGAGQAAAATGPYYVGDADGFNQFFNGSIADLVVVPFSNDATPMTAPEQHEIIMSARNLTNNGQTSVPLINRSKYTTPAGWSSGVTNEISLYVTGKYSANTLRDSQGLSPLTGDDSKAISSTGGQMFVQFPDANGKVSWHFGPAIFSGLETDARVLRAAYNYAGREDAHGYRSWGFHSSADQGTRITEGGFVLQQSSALNTGSWASEKIVIGNPSNVFNGQELTRDISEVILYSRDLNIAEQRLITNYLSAKYGQSPPQANWYTGDEAANGDFDNDVIGVANSGASQHTSSTGGGLTLTNSTFLSSGVNDTHYVVAGHKTGGMKAAGLPANIALAWERWWRFDVSAKNSGVDVLDTAGTVQVSVDYAATSRVIPPAVRHHLLYSAEQGGPFISVASAVSTPGTVDFGLLAGGSQLKTGYYAIGYERPATPVPVPAKTYTFTFSAGANTAVRAGNSWQVNATSADAALVTALTEINARPNDGSVYYLDLTALLKPGAGPTSATNELVINRANDWPAINRNLIIRGPDTGFPGRLAFNGQNARNVFSINDGMVELKNLTIRNGQTALGGGVRIFRGDVLLDSCILKDCKARGAEAGYLLNIPFGTAGRHGGFGARGARGENAVASTPGDFSTHNGAPYPRFNTGGNGGFAAGGGAQGVKAAGAGNFTWSGNGGWGACMGDGFSSGGFGSEGADAGLGGGIFQYRGKLRLYKTSLTGNAANGGAGGHRYRADSSGRMAESTVFAAGLGGAVFLWDEAGLESIEHSFVSGNTSDTGPANANGVFRFDPPLPGGVSTADFYGVGFPSVATINTNSNLLAALSYINPVTGVVNSSSPLAYEYLLYVKTGAGNVVPQYATFETTLGTSAALAALDTKIVELKALAAANPGTTFIQRLLLDVIFHRAMIHGIRGDTRHQKCVDGPLTAGFQTDLNAEITELNAARDEYDLAISGYFDCLKDASAYAAFKQFVPDAPYHVFYYNEAGVFLPVPGVAGGNLANWEATQFRDVAVLFDLLSDMGRTSELLIEMYLRRSQVTGGVPVDRNAALAIATQGQRDLQMWGDTLLAIFGNSLVLDDFRTPGLERSIGLWRESVSQLTTLQSALLGKKNMLGYSDDFLMLLPVSDIATQTGNLSFHSYDGFVKLLDDPSGFLGQAKSKLATARTAHAAFIATKSALQTEALQLITSSNERLMELTKRLPGQAGFTTPWLNAGSEIWEQYNNIQRARNEITRNAIRINSLEREVHIEIQRVETQKGLNIARDSLTVVYEGKVAKIDEKIGAIQTTQNVLGGITDVLDPELITGGPLGIGVLAAKLVNVAAQEGAEQGKAVFEAQKGELAAQLKKDETSITNQVLDADSKALISTRLLAMEELNLDSIVAAQNLGQELARLAVMMDEVSELQEKIKLAQTSIGDRIFADPSQRLEVEREYQDALFAFRRAQQWLFFTTRALEYKRSLPFSTNSNGGYNLQRLFKLRSADELDAYYTELKNFNTNTNTSDNQLFDWFSVRENGLNITDSPLQNDTAADDAQFSAAFQLKTNEFGQQRYFLNFSTYRDLDNSNFLTPNNYVDKIRSIKVLITYKSGTPAPGPTLGGATIRYGDVSYFRTRTFGTVNPLAADELLHEFNTFVNRDWAFDSVSCRYVQTRYAPISLSVAQALTGTQTSDEAAVASGTFEFTGFRERSVAATGWELQLPTTVNVNTIKDVKILFAHFASNRSAGP